MGASIDDINLTIISNGERAYYCGVKGIGNIIWDTRLGIFSGVKPVAGRALDFTIGEDMEDAVMALEAPLEEASYGSVTIDFDAKTVLDDNTWGYSTVIQSNWLRDAIEYGLMGRDYSMFPAASVLEHLQNHRIVMIDTQAESLESRFEKQLESTTLEAAKIELADLCRKHRDIGPQPVLSLPDDWHYLPEPVEA